MTAARKPGKSAQPRFQKRRAAPESARPIKHLSREAVQVLHRESLAEHGGLDGLRDAGLLDSALDRCRNKASYEPESSVAALAAALAYGLARNHCFNDGNKRISLIASFAFAQINGLRVTASEPVAYAAILALAAGELSESQMADWFAKHSLPRRSRR